MPLEQLLLILSCIMFVRSPDSGWGYVLFASAIIVMIAKLSLHE